MLSVFILTLLLQGSVCDGCSVDHDEELVNQVFVGIEFFLAQPKFSRSFARNHMLLAEHTLLLAEQGPEIRRRGCLS